MNYVYFNWQTLAATDWWIIIRSPVSTSFSPSEPYMSLRNLQSVYIGRPEFSSSWLPDSTVLFSPSRSCLSLKSKPQVTWGRIVWVALEPPPSISFNSFLPIVWLGCFLLGLLLVFCLRWSSWIPVPSLKSRPWTPGAGTQLIYIFTPSKDSTNLA